LSQTAWGRTILAPMAQLRCNVVTPTESVLECDATYVEFPAWDGQKGVAPGAAPFLVRLGEGRLRIERSSGAPEFFLLDGGFAQMNGGTLTILADGATSANSIKTADAEKELAAANTAASTRGNLDARDLAERRQRLAYARVALARSGGARR
jgi:F-type H+-transporting ATPase subunit epsilon